MCISSVRYVPIRLQLRSPAIYIDWKHEYCPLLDVQFVCTSMTLADQFSNWFSGFLLTLVPSGQYPFDVTPSVRFIRTKSVYLCTPLGTAAVGLKPLELDVLVICCPVHRRTAARSTW